MLRAVDDSDNMNETIVAELSTIRSVLDNFYASGKLLRQETSRLLSHDSALTALPGIMPTLERYLLDRAWPASPSLSSVMKSPTCIDEQTGACNAVASDLSSGQFNSDNLGLASSLRRAVSMVRSRPTQSRVLIRDDASAPRIDTARSQKWHTASNNEVVVHDASATSRLDDVALQLPPRFVASSRRKRDAQRCKTEGDVEHQSPEVTVEDRDRHRTSVISTLDWRGKYDHNPRPKAHFLTTLHASSSAHRAHAANAGMPRASFGGNSDPQRRTRTESTRGLRNSPQNCESTTLTPTLVEQLTKRMDQSAHENMPMAMANLHVHSPEKPYRATEAVHWRGARLPPNHAARRHFRGVNTAKMEAADDDLGFTTPALRTRRDRSSSSSSSSRSSVGSDVDWLPVSMRVYRSHSMSQASLPVRDVQFMMPILHHEFTPAPSKIQPRGGPATPQSRSDSESEREPAAGAMDSFSTQARESGKDTSSHSKMVPLEAHIVDAAAEISRKTSPYVNTATTRICVGARNIVCNSPIAIDNAVRRAAVPAATNYCAGRREQQVGTASRITTCSGSLAALQRSKAAVRQVLGKSWFPAGVLLSSAVRRSGRSKLDARRSASPHLRRSTLVDSHHADGIADAATSWAPPFGWSSPQLMHTSPVQLESAVVVRRFVNVVGR